MRVLLDHPRVDVSSSMATITTDEEADGYDLSAPWADETNGLCGAGVPGMLELITGTHTGYVPFRIELCESEPAVDPEWEEVVDVSFRTEFDAAFLTGLMGEERPFDLPRGEYRVRYCASEFDEAMVSDDGPDSYLLQFWPAPPAPGRIVVQTSERAKAWHRSRRTVAPEELNEQELRDAAERRDRARERWGDRLPNDPLMELVDAGSPLSVLTELDVELEFAIADADESIHRQIAAWAALRCLEVSGLSTKPLLAPAVDALRRGESAPPPFDQLRYGWDVLEWSRVRRTSVPAPPDGAGSESPEEWAIRTLQHSTERNPLISALQNVVCLAYVHGRDGYRRAFADLRAEFPGV